MTDTTGTSGGADQSPEGGRPRAKAASNAAPVYAAGIMVAGGLLFGTWGVANAALDGDGIFGGKDDQKVTAEAPTREPGTDGVVTLPDLDENGVPDEYEDVDGKSEGRHQGGSSEDSDSKGTSGRGDEDGSTNSKEGRGETSKEESTQTYIIEWGDTLSEISAETGVPIGTLVKENDIQDPNLIYAGSALLIPQA